jgi:hypothetical protein
MDSELVKFLQLKSENPHVSPSHSIDKLWHTFILDTKQYREYCMQNFGKIIHHNPMDSENQDLRFDRLKETYKLYQSKFGNLDKEMWNIKQCQMCNQEIED